CTSWRPSCPPPLLVQALPTAERGDAVDLFEVLGRPVPLAGRGLAAGARVFLPAFHWRAARFIRLFGRRTFRASHLPSSSRLGLLNFEATHHLIRRTDRLRPIP